LLSDAALAHRRRATPQVDLLGVVPAVIGHPWVGNHIDVILPETGPTRDHTPSRKTPAT
jgi:hypothetical protein